MKTLKKTLCLVLAVVMVVGVLVLPANAAATTAADTEATAAFNTLNKYGVMNGVDANNTPALDKNINRQDMAAIIYRIMTGDTAGTYVANYAGSANGFADSATFATWAKGYIGYVRTNGIFVGDNNGNFKPTEEITGYDVLTVLLRCLGYGQNGEFTGAAYAQNALTTAAQINMFGGATNFKNVTEDMSKVINRGVVAKLTFNAIQAPIAVYYNGTYSVYQDNQGRPSAPGIGTLNPSLVVFDDGATKSNDKWGAPVIEYDPVISFTKSYNSAPKHLGKYTEAVPFKGQYYVATTECDVSEDGGIATSASLEDYLNGVKQEDTIDIQATDTVGTVGEQGQWVRTYDVDGDGKIDRVVRVDTLLAQVLEVTKEEKDPAGHIKVSASLSLSVYTATDNDPTNDTANYVVAGNDYKKGDFILLRAVTTDGTTLSADATTLAGTYYEIIGAAPQFPGAQTTIWYNRASHVIDGKEYPDNNRLHLDVAQTTGGNYVWFTDGNGNIIGSVEAEAAPASYAILKNMIWKTGNPGHAEATLLYMDGTEATVTVASIDGGANPYATTTADDAVPTATDGVAKAVGFDSGDTAAYVSDEGSFNTMYYGYALYAVTVKSNGSVKLDAADFKNSDTQLKAKDIKLITTSGSEMYVSDNTVFIYRNVVNGAVTYTRVVGKDNIIGLTTPSIFYVDTNTDKVAEYVYVVTGTAAAAELSHLVAALNDKYSKGLYDGDEIYTLDKALVGGEEVPAGTIYADESHKTNITDTLAGNPGKLYWVTETNGKIDTAPTEITAGGNKMSDGTGSPTYATDEAVYLLDSTVKISVSGGIISISKIGSEKNIVMAASDLKTVYGADKDKLADVEWSKVNAYVVVKDGVVTDMYILTPPEKANNPSKPEEPSKVSDITVNAPITISNDGSEVKLSINLKDGSTDKLSGKEVKVTGKIQALSLGSAKWEDVYTINVTNSSFVSESPTEVTIYTGALSEVMTYQVIYTITVDGKTIATAVDQIIGVPKATV